MQTGRYTYRKTGSSKYNLTDGQTVKIGKQTKAHIHVTNSHTDIHGHLQRLVDRYCHADVRRPIWTDRDCNRNDIDKNVHARTHTHTHTYTHT